MRRSIEAAVATLALAWLIVLAPLHASADDYDASNAGFPLRIVAYVLHPVGVMLDVLIFRPAHWLGSQPVISDLVGHDADDSQ